VAARDGLAPLALIAALRPRALRAKPRAVFPQSPDCIVARVEEIVEAS
jgi:hypothetical protein